MKTPSESTTELVFPKNPIILPTELLDMGEIWFLSPTIWPMNLLEVRMKHYC